VLVQVEGNKCHFEDATGISQNKDLTALSFPAMRGFSLHMRTEGSKCNQRYCLDYESPDRTVATV
jgi:hypothetical protein